MLGSQKSDGWITLGLKQQLKLSFYVVLGKWTLMKIACKICHFEIPAVSDQFCGRLKIFEVIGFEKNFSKWNKKPMHHFQKILIENPVFAPSFFRPWIWKIDVEHIDAPFLKIII